MFRCNQTLACLILLMGCFVSYAARAARSGTPPRVDPNGTIHVPAFALPESSYLTPESRTELARERQPSLDAFEAAVNACPAAVRAKIDELPAIRRCQARAFAATSFYRRLRERYPVIVTPRVIGGVYTEVIVPQNGVASRNRHRVLINLHGGSFSGGSRINSQVESIPIASIARIKVISVDYRLAPQFHFPAASEDVAAVYQQVLKRYRAEEIGIYGCSSGGALTAQAVAWFGRNGLPRPGAIGLFCYGAGRALNATTERWMRSDSAYFVGALTGTYDQLLEPLSYYRGVNLGNPLVSPGDYDEVMARFPPTLLISGTRDYLLSSVVSTHAQLVRLGVAADLHVWEGMQHAFLYFPDLPESREAYRVIADFFGRHLGLNMGCPRPALPGFQRPRRPDESGGLLCSVRSTASRRDSPRARRLAQSSFSASAKETATAASCILRRDNRVMRSPIWPFGTV